MLRFYTAGESHGQALLAFISGLPASLPVNVEFINHELHRRQLGYGRGGRQKIEKDRAEIFAGVRRGETIGAPIALRIENRDWANWERILPVEASANARRRGTSIGRATAGSCGPGGIAEIQFSRRALCFGTGFGTRDGGTRGRRGHCQAVAAGIWDGDRESYGAGRACATGREALAWDEIKHGYAQTSIRRSAAWIPRYRTR